MSLKTGYCPICDVTIEADTIDSYGYCPDCGHRIAMYETSDSIYYVEDAVIFVHNKTGIDEQLIRNVLDAEEDYMRSLGLIVEMEE